MARLKPGVSIAQARAEMNAIQRSLAEQYPEDRNAYAVEVQPLLEYVVEAEVIARHCIYCSER